ncbi:MAG: M56 family metallopeptidase [Acidobacteriaceae bacterium]
MANHLWQSTVFAAVVVLLALALRKNQARARYWLWMTASMKFLVPFSLLIVMGSYLPKPARPAPAQLGMYSAIEEVGQPFAQPEAPVIYSAAPLATPANPIHLIPVLLVAAWLSGVLVTLFVWAVSWLRISTVMRRAVPILEGREMEALRRLESVAGVRKRIKLLLSRNSMEPGIFGIFRPVLIWPEGISQHLEDRHIEAILAHEVCHVRRRDNLTAALHMLVEAIFWFHPLVWWIGARLIEERERACDEEVTLLCKQPQVYAESILKVCKFCSESPLACVSGITGADLKKRILQIMTERIVRKLTLGKKLVLVAVGLVVVAVPILLGQSEAARRMMVAAADAAPIPFRAAAHAMIAEEQTPSTALIAELQPNPAVPNAAQATAQPEVRYGMAESWIPQPDAPAVITSGSFSRSRDDTGKNDLLVGARIDSKSKEDIVFFRMGWVYVLPNGLEFDKGETVVPYNGLHPGGTFGVPEWHVPLRKDATALLIFLEEVTLDHGPRWEADHKQIEDYIKSHSGMGHAMQAAAAMSVIQAASSSSQSAPTSAPLNTVVDAPIDAVPPNINFDVVSFKRCPPDKFGTTKVDMPMTADYLAYHCESLSRIISFAYRGSVKTYSLESGYPKWVDDDRYEFIVKVAPEEFAAWQKLDLTARRLVMRKVLADAVKLKIRVDNSPKAIYALTAMKKVHLTTYKEGDQTKLPDGRVQHGTSHDWTDTTSYYQAFTMAGLAEILSNRMDRVVADHTNLTGQYTFVMPVFGGINMEPDAHIGLGEDSPTVEDVLEQLGLQLKPAKGPVERLVIDHIEKPQEN